MTDNESNTFLSNFVSVAGYVLGISYPVLALSTGVRALYQIFFRADITNKLGPTLTAVAAVIYIIAAVGFMRRRKWAWRMSVGALVIETLGVVVVGLLSFVAPQMFEHTVWRHFGQDYGFFPFFQPLLGLSWLLWPETLKAYGIASRRDSPDPE
jgi:hypothetical protein